MSKISSQELQEIAKAAQDVILLLADEHPDYGNFEGMNTSKMVEFYDHLNDRAATPEIVRSMALDLLSCRSECGRLNSDLDHMAKSLIHFASKAYRLEAELNALKGGEAKDE